MSNNTNIICRQNIETEINVKLQGIECRQDTVTYISIIARISNVAI
jgi:hypothetical protein